MPSSQQTKAGRWKVSDDSEPLRVVGSSLSPLRLVSTSMWLHENAPMQVVSGVEITISHQLMCVHLSHRFRQGQCEFDMSYSILCFDETIPRKENGFAKGVCVCV